MALPLSQAGPPDEPEEGPSSSGVAALREDRGRRAQQEPQTPPPPVLRTPSSSSTSAPSLASASSSSGSRKRVRSKTPAGRTGAWSNSDGLPSAVAFAAALAEAAHVNAEAQQPVPKVQDYASTMEAVRRQHCSEVLAKAKQLNPEATVRTLRAKMRLEFSHLTAKQKEALCRRTHENCPDDLKEDVLARAELFKLEAEEGKAQYARGPAWLNSRSFLLTWQHRSWVWKREGGFGTLAEAVQFLREDSRANAIWDKFQTEQAKTLTKLRLEALTLAAEINVESFEACGRTEVKLHFHAFGHTVQGKLRYDRPEGAGHIFWGVRPNNNAIPGIVFRGERDTGKKDKSSDKAIQWAGHYYLVCEAKLGTVFTWSSKRVFKDYRVKPQWLTAWLSAIAINCLPSL